jgi:hypothetical protein
VKRSVREIKRYIYDDDDDDDDDDDVIINEYLLNAFLPFQRVGGDEEGELKGEIIKCRLFLFDGTIYI